MSQAVESVSGDQESMDQPISTNEMSSASKETVGHNHTNNSCLQNQNQKTRKPGYANIKSEYLLLDYKPKLQTEYLSEEVKEKIAATKEECQTQDDNVSEPPNKKAKLKGRNKHRPRNERVEQKDKLCPSIKEGRECKYGDGCKFNHDVKDFLEKKRADIQEKCPIFETLGYCRSGVTCRFASSHLGEDNENLVNKELYEKMKGSPRCLNNLSDETRRKMWKKKYDFSLSMKSVKDVQNSFNGQNNKNDVISKCNDKEMIKSVDDCVDEIDDPRNEGDLSPSKVTETVNDHINPTGPSVDTSSDSVPIGETAIIDDVPICVTSREVKKIDFHNKLYLAPLTTVGNLPFRRVCKNYGAEITCGEMALASQLLKAKASEWSLIKRHPSEDIFGVQICGAYPDMMTKCAQVLTETTDIDFIDINCGCPIDLVFKKGSGSALMGKATKLEHICRSMIGVMGEKPLTVKLRTGVFDNKNVAHNIIPRLKDAGVSLVTIHGRSREQRYTKLADWQYIEECARLGHPMPVYGNGDILSFEDANLHMERNGVSGVMLARGALIKPWIFTEIKEQRHWDISSSERLDILRSYTNYGLEHWGSDHQGVESTRRFLLEWLSFLHRYIPVGVLEQVPQKINERPPYYIGRNDLETLMASANCADWVKISEMLLGPVPQNFQFLPKHKANAYQ